MAVVNNTHVALLGGQTEAGGEAASNSFYLYNLNTNEWTSLPALPTGRMGHICEIIGKTLFLRVWNMESSYFLSPRPMWRPLSNKQTVSELLSY